MRSGTLAYRSVTGHNPTKSTSRWLGTGAHYGFGAALGAVYGLAAHRTPGLRAGCGLLYGSLVWAVADEGAMPALGLSRGPRELPIGVHLYALAGHWVYGATLEGTMRVLSAELKSL